MHKDIKYELVSKEEIASTVAKLADSINKDFENEPLTAIIILKGSIIFAADLIRELKMPLTLEFMKVSSYGSGSESSGEIKIQLDTKSDLTGKNVLLIEDIIDSGNTLSKLKKLLSDRNPKSIKLCTLLDKPERRETPITADYTGREIPNEFVVGYGLDYAESYRHLPYIGVLDEKVYM